MTASPCRQTGLFGGFGGAKTTALMLRHLKIAALNGNDRRRKRLSVPKCAIISPTFRTLMESTMACFYEVCDPRWIRRVRGLPVPYVELVNDVVIELHSSCGTLEGHTYFQISVDEAAHEKYSEAQLTNLVARVRDGNAVFNAVNACGLAEAGHAQRIYDRPIEHPSSPAGGHWTILCSTADNLAIDPATVHAILATCSSEEAKRVVRGVWGQPQGALFGNYDRSVHLTDEAGDPNCPTNIAIDPGHVAAVLFAQPYAVRAILPAFRGLGPGTAFNDTGMHIVDQILPEGKDMSGICEMILAHPRQWPIVPRRSKIIHDPTLSAEERKVLRKYFPGVRIKEASNENRAVRARVQTFRRGLRDGHQVVRVKIWEGLEGAGRGICEAIVGSKSKDNDPDQPRPDKVLEHIRDCGLYLGEDMIPRPYKHAL